MSTRTVVTSTVATLGLAVSWVVAPALLPGLETPARAEDQAAAHARGGLAAIVREATAAYRDLDAALADGYVPATPCVTGPEEGAMGFHYAKPALLGDGAVDAQTPEILIYEETVPGDLRLVGVEYLAIADAWDANNEGPATLEGHLFHFSGSPNRYRLPAFYALHVWAWKHNPNGAYVNWNPRVSCR